MAKFKILPSFGEAPEDLEALEETAKAERKEAEQAFLNAAEEDRQAKEAEDALASAKVRAAMAHEAAAKTAAKGRKPVDKAVLVDPPAKPKRRLKAKANTVYCPYSKVRVTTSGTPEKVEISTWMQAQIDAGLVSIVEE